ncbi:uncharacterized protein [Primulina huaijiensis]|uniref:uncharacterized protein isoform X4 n=1 Tax=Primulina huaijiensis TaxID=1492673 RepID=UPI003CC755A3
MLELRDGRCYPKEVVGVDLGLACVDGGIAIIAFYQMIRIHLRNSHLGWTAQKVFHLLIGTSNFGYLLYFGLTPLAACKDWLFWPQSCGFIIMGMQLFPKFCLLRHFFYSYHFGWTFAIKQMMMKKTKNVAPEKPYWRRSVKLIIVPVVAAIFAPFGLLK